ncbi:MAG: hypothetical protein ACRC1Z_07015 [Waterburya sp.]
MYFVNVLAKLDQQTSIVFFWSKSKIKLKIKLKEYYEYLLIFKGDYRWLLVFIIGRLPWGRTLGKFFYSDRRARRDPKGLAIASASAKAYPLKFPEENRATWGSSHHHLTAEQKHARERKLSIFQDLEPEVAVKSIEQDGYYPGLQLPGTILKELLEYADTADISIDGKSGFEFKYGDRNQAAKKYKCEILTGNYLAVNSECSAMQKLTNDPKLREIAGKYLGKEPILVRSQMSWTFIGSKEAYAQKGVIGSPTVLFHYDLDDYRTLKFFFYLTDVDSFSGSHRFVVGSHKKRKLSHYLFRSQSDEAIADYYGAENVVDICGQAGFGFAEDPFCFHRGSPPATAHRLMIHLEFALNNYGVWQL